MGQIRYTEDQTLSLQVGACLVHNAGGNLGVNLYLVTAEYAMDDTNIGAVIARASSFSGVSGTSTTTADTTTGAITTTYSATDYDGFNQGEIHANHKFGAVTLAGYTNKSNQTDYDKVGAGIGASYELGSGARLSSSYQHPVTGKNHADLGVVFSF